MEIFVASSLAYLEYRRIRGILSAPQCAFHSNAQSDINSPPLAFCNLYCNPSALQSQHGWWPSLVMKAISSHPHEYCAIELLDWFGQLQTSTMFIWRNAVRVLKNMTGLGHTRFKRELLTMTDGGTIALDWIVGDDGRISADRPIVIMLHGIVGDSQAEYLYHYGYQLHCAGYQPVAMVARGCGSLVLTSPSLFAGTIPFDLYECIHHLQDRFGKDHKLFAIGYSLGASSLLSYLGLCKGRRPSGLTAAFCMSPPWCFRQTCLQPSWVGTVWSLLIALPLKLHYFMHARNLREQSVEYKIISLFEVATCLNVTAFDRICHHAYHKMDRYSILLPNEGKAWIERGNRRYHSLVDYYNDISPCHITSDVDTPTLVFSAIDDPVCPHQYCPAPHAFSEHLLVAKTLFGGHLGFLDGKLWYGSWTDYVTTEIMNRLR